MILQSIEQYKLECLYYLLSSEINKAAPEEMGPEIAQILGVVEK